MTTGRDLGLIALRNSKYQDLSGWCQYFVGLLISASLGKPAPGGYLSATDAKNASKLEFTNPANVPIGGILYWEFGAPGHVSVKIGDDIMIHASANESGLIESLGRGVKITRISGYNRKFLGGSRRNGTRDVIAGLTSYVPQGSKPGTPGLSVDAVAREVIAGKWGNGDVRRQKLVQAGYDYAAVQARVNQILAGGAPAPSLKDLDTIAREVIAGQWGNGTDRQSRLQGAGYDYDAVQARVNQILGQTGNSTVKPARKYTVRTGDSLSAIASRFGIVGGWQAIYNLNRAVIGKNPNLIRAGQVLTLP